MIRSAAVAVAVGSLLLAGCTAAEADKPAAVSSTSDNGISGKAPAEILSQARKSLAEATSFHASGELPGVFRGGSKFGDGTPVPIDLKVSGANQLGRMTIAGSEIQVLVSGGRTFFKVPEKALVPVIGAAAAHRLAPRLAASWIEPAPGLTYFDALGRSFARDQLVTLEGDLEQLKPAKVGDRPAVGLRSSAGYGATLLVSAVGEPVPLVLIYPGAPRAGKVEFTEYGATFPGLDVPAAADIIALPAGTAGA
ncbi:hypothetical protein L3i22_070920 [Actinoplanes sp. L3-i22]|nr:hypothetical protein L3i22_070920 [Actinoplanes sp. L3-i22]